MKREWDWMIDIDKYEGHAPLILAAYDKQVRWINDILFRLEKMQEASEEYRSRYLQTVYEELEMMIK